MNLLAPLLLALLPLPPQEPTDVVARFELGGRPAAVTRADVAVEMAFHLRRQDLGLQAVEVLVDAALTRKAALSKGLMPSDAEVRKFWTDLQAELRAAGQKPEEIAAVRNTSEAEWLRYIAVQMAQERLVRAELGLPGDEKISGDMLRLWQQETRKKAQVVTDPDVLPIGVAAQIDGETVPMVELGLLLLRTSEDHERDKFIHQVVYLQCIEALAKQHGIEATAQDLDAAVAERTADAARDPRYRGLSFEQLLKSQGLSVAGLKQSRVFRANKVLLQKLAAKLHPDAQLREEVQRDRQAVLELVGPRRRIGMIFVRALDEPNALIPLDFPAALQKLAAVRERLQKDRFDVVAKIESQEPASKARGGDCGWHGRKSDKLPTTVLDAAWTLGKDEVSQPLRDRDGCFLVKVTDIEPDPTDEQLLARWREHRTQQLSQQILTDSKLELLDGKSAREKGR
jgi:hypothetical protein